MAVGLFKRRKGFRLGVAIERLMRTQTSRDVGQALVVIGVEGQRALCDVIIVVAAAGGFTLVLLHQTRSWLCRVVC